MKIHKGDKVYRGSAPTRAMIRRMKRTHLALIPVERAATTPSRVIADFFVEHGIVGDGWVAELSSRLHRGGVFFFADDGVVHGTLISETLTAIGEAIETQGDLIAGNRWVERNRLRLLADRYSRELADILGDLGMA